MKQIIVSSVITAILMGMVGCSSAPEKTEQPVPPQAAPPPPTVEKYTAPGMVGQKVTMVAVVEAIDLATRQVTLRGPQGNTQTITVGEEARNLPQLKVGDRVVVDFYQGLAMALTPSRTGVRKRVETTTEQRAALGQKPGGMVVQTVEVDATVQAVDLKARTVTLRGPKRTLTLDVAKDVNLNQVKVGDQVHAVYQEALAISVRPAEGQQ